MQVDVRCGSPRFAVVPRRSDVEESNLDGLAASRPVLNRSSDTGGSEPVPVVDGLVAELQVVTSQSVGKVIRQLGLDLRLAAFERPEAKRSARPPLRIERDCRGTGGGIRCRRERRVKREAACRCVEEGSICERALPFALVHPRYAVLAEDGFRSIEDRDSAAGLLLA